MMKSKEDSTGIVEVREVTKIFKPQHTIHIQIYNIKNPHIEYNIVSGQYISVEKKEERKEREREETRKKGKDRESDTKGKRNTMMAKDSNNNC